MYLIRFFIGFIFKKLIVIYICLLFKTLLHFHVVVNQLHNSHYLSLIYFLPKTYKTTRKHIRKPINPAYV